TVRLRKIRWSDGTPFTADDVMFWWKYWCNWKDPDTGDPLGYVPELMIVAGETGQLEKVDTHTVRYIFSKPNGIFLDFMASARGACYPPMPAHYLEKYHPELGDQKLIEKLMAAHSLPGKSAVFDFVNQPTNPERPSLAPWLIRTHRDKGPHTLVRNPYYFAVDEQGNQLPYMDRVLLLVKNPSMTSISVANGEASVQAARFEDYGQLMTQKETRGYALRFWHPAGTSKFIINPNMNLNVDPDRPDTAKKAKLLNEKRFRQALSLAIDRQAIINAEWYGVGTPSQVAPGPGSPYYHPRLSRSFTEYIPTKANALLDQLGLDSFDAEGFRTFADGTRMVFYLNVSTDSNQAGVANLVLRYWADVGVRVIMRERSNQLYRAELFARTADFIVSEDDSTHIALSSKFLVPQPWTMYATGWGHWYYNSRESKSERCVKPPDDHPIMEVFRLFDKACQHRSAEKRMEYFGPIMDLAAENVWCIGLATAPPIPVVVKNGLKGVPAHSLYGFLDFINFNNAYPETWYWETPEYLPGEREAILGEITTITPQSPLSNTASFAAQIEPSSAVGSWAGRIALLAFVVGMLALSIKCPYVGRRILLMVPSLLVISIVVFVIIQLPPGDYVSTYIENLRMQGQDVSQGEIQMLEERFYLNDPMPVRYLRWMGFKWFAGFHPKDRGLLQGHLGWSMAHRKPVNDIIGSRLLLTFCISLGAIVLTWAIAIPIGIYSAVKQYSIPDYVLTFFGFIGICVPPFLLALILIYLTDRLFGITVTGLFSPEYEMQPDWSWGKIVDLMKHIWLPVVVMGFGGTAGMIRIMRANLLDELKRPYVTTAIAKGVRPFKLLMKYPVRMALNPFISGIGGIFPQLISGGAIVAMVLSLPTIGPLLLDAVMSEDTSLAGSMLMILSLLGIVGVLVSDVLLLWLDPRIRFDKR
ncbi:MAG: ABC transporter permease subunit, partial [Verrucomicrobia bacterium]|nr:ABC transporter permease subunit [Verrucomicrobiota bacterium]